MKDLCFLNTPAPLNDEVDPDALSFVSKAGIIHRRNTARRFDRMFYGPMISTFQCGALYFVGADYGPRNAHLIEGLGTQKYWESVITPSVKARVECGMKPMEALIGSYTIGQIDELARKALEALQEMFGLMQDNEVAVTFGVSPAMELAAYSLMEGKLSPAHRDLRVMWGLQFSSAMGRIFVSPDLISAPLRNSSTDCAYMRGKQ